MTLFIYLEIAVETGREYIWISGVVLVMGPEHQVVDSTRYCMSWTPTDLRSYQTFPVYSNVK